MVKMKEPAVWRPVDLNSSSALPCLLTSLVIAKMLHVELRAVLHFIADRCGSCTLCFDLYKQWQIFGHMIHFCDVADSCPLPVNLHERPAPDTISSWEHLLKCSVMLQGWVQTDFEWLQNKQGKWLHIIGGKCSLIVAVISVREVYNALPWSWQDVDMDQYDEEEDDDEDMEEDDEEEEEEDEEEEPDGLPFRNPYNDVSDDDEEEDEEEDGEEEEAEGRNWEHAGDVLHEADGEDEGDEEEEMDDDALGGEAPRGPGYDQFGHMLGSGFSATQARRMELAGKYIYIHTCYNPLCMCHHVSVVSTYSSSEPLLQQVHDLSSGGVALSCSDLFLHFAYRTCLMHFLACWNPSAIVWLTVIQVAVVSVTAFVLCTPKWPLVGSELLVVLKGSQTLC